MTADEIKQSISMTQLVTRYGLKPNQKGFICCPFHKEKTSSCKIYKDSYYCFGCGDSGDVYTFVQKMDGVSFKEAFYSLGGHYEKPSYASKLAAYRYEKAREKEILDRQKKAAEKEHVCALIGAYMYGIQNSEPLSETWCECMNKMQYQLYLLEELSNRKEVG